MRADLLCSNAALVQNLTFGSAAPANSPVVSPLGPAGLYSFPDWSYDVFNSSSNGGFPRAIYQLANDQNSPAIVTVNAPLGVRICSLVMSSYTVNGTVTVTGTSTIVGLTPAVTGSAALPGFPQTLAIPFDITWQGIKSINITTLGLRGPDLWAIYYI